MMRIAIVGAGAIGAYMGARLALAGEDVTLIARGAHLEAMQRDGLTLLTTTDGGEEVREHATPRAVETPEQASPQDVVILTLKAHQVAEMAPRLAPMLGPDTSVVTAQNGVPWWYFHGYEGPLAGTRLSSVDPDDVIWDAITPERVIGCVVYPATELMAPGIVRHLSGDRFSLGEPDGARSDRIRDLSQAMISAGLRTSVRRRLRNELWIKLWGNVAFNPISVLTGGTLAAICAHPGTRAVAREAMLEAQAVAHALGEEFKIDVDQRIEGAAAVGEHKTSMLQDFERGRHLEISAIVGAVTELSRLVAVPTPTIDTFYALTSLIDERLSP
jgi:2-dehydropantoate 2-reductase